MPTPIPTAETDALHSENAQLRHELAQLRDWVTSLDSLLVFSSAATLRSAPQQLLRQLISMAVDVFQTDGGFGALFDGERVNSDGYMHRGTWLPEPRSWELHDGLPGSALGHGWHHLANDYASEPLAEPDWRSRFGVARALCVPIIGAGSEALGVFELHRSAGQPAFNHHEVGFLESLANIAAVAMANARLLGDLETKQRQLEALSAQQVAAIEHERKRLARELHDETGQALIGVKLGLQVLANRMPPDRDDLRADAQQLREEVNAAAERIKQLARALRPPTLDALGLSAALHQLAQDLQPLAAARLHVDAVLNTRPSPEIETALYRIAQEGLTNALNHADATDIWISMIASARTITMTIRDNGRGFDPAHGPSGRLGLLGARERCSMLEGSFSVQSAPGHGTELVASIPLSP